MDTVTTIAAALQRGRAQGLFAHARLWLGSPDGRCLEYACGDAEWYDLASLTKPLVGTALFAWAWAQGRLQPESPVIEAVPDFAPASSMRWVDLLNHHAGLVAYRAWYRALDCAHPDAQGLWQQVRNERLVTAPGTRELYSDTGYIVLARGLSAVLGELAAPAFAARIAAPLGLAADLAYAVPSGATVAATGLCPYRGRLLRGEVHDANAWHLGTQALHAGLFGTAAGVGRLALAWLAAPEHGLPDIPAAIAAQMLRPPPLIPHSTRPLGWDRPGPGASQAGNADPAAFGHLGFTGTSVWVDPHRQVAVVLLSDRVAHDLDGAGFRAWRPELHNTIWAALDAGLLTAADAHGPTLRIVVD